LLESPGGCSSGAIRPAGAASGSRASSPPGRRAARSRGARPPPRGGSVARGRATGRQSTLATLATRRDAASGLGRTDPDATTADATGTIDRGTAGARRPPRRRGPTTAAAAAGATCGAATAGWCGSSRATRQHRERGHEQKRRSSRAEPQDQLLVSTLS